MSDADVDRSKTTRSAREILGLSKFDKPEDEIIDFDIDMNNQVRKQRNQRVRKEIDKLPLDLAKEYFKARDTLKLTDTEFAEYMSRQVLQVLMKGGQVTNFMAAKVLELWELADIDRGRIE